MSGIMGMMGMIIPPEVIGPGATVGSQIGPVCVMRPRSGLPDEDCEREVPEGCGDATGACEEELDVPKFNASEEEADICAEVLDMGVSNEVLDNPPLDRDEEVKVRCVVDNEAVVPDVEYRVAVPLNHVVFAVRVHETEDAGLVELSQSQYMPHPGLPQPRPCAPLTSILLQ